MRVIIIADFAVPSGGAQRVAIESARALAESGVNVTFLHAVAGRHPALDHPSIEPVCLHLPDVWSRGALSGAINGIWNGRARARVADALKAHAGARDAILHLHQWTRAFSPAIFAALRASGLPTVVTAHDYFLACPNGVLFRFDQKEPCALAPMSMSCVTTNCDARSYPHKLVRVARQAATSRQWGDWRVDVIHIADSARDRLAPLLPRHWRHRRVDNPIAVARAAPVDIGPDTAFAYVGRLTEDKGALVAARAAASIGAPMLFIGEGPARAEIASLLPGATITGWVAPAEVDALLRQRARAVLAPSLWPETGPMTTLEAAAIGLPSVVSNRCGASEKVAAGTGAVAEPSVDVFAKAMRPFLDTATASAAGRAAHAHFWADPPTPARHARDLLLVYEAILAG